MQIEDVEIFLQIVESGSLSRAAKLLGRPKASVSHNVRRLETDLGLELFDRQKNTLLLNEAGTNFLDHAKGIKKHVESARDDASRLRVERQGIIRIASTSEFASNIMSSIFMGFANELTGLNICAMTYPREVLAEIRAQYDTIIYLGTPEVPEFSEMKARRLGQFRNKFYASPEYLKSRAPPTKPEQLAAHRLLVQTNKRNPENWRIRKGSNFTRIAPDPAFVSNDPWIVKLAAVHGRGICFLPEFFARQEKLNGMLVPVLSGWSSDKVTVHALYWAHRFANPNLKLLLDKAASSFGEIDHYLYRASRPN